MLTKSPFPRTVVAVALFGLALSVAAQPATSQVTRSGSGYLFRVKYTKGARLDYQLISVWPKPARPSDPKRMEGPLSMTVLDVAGGVATIRVEAGPFSLDGRRDLARPNTMQLKMDNRGKIVEGGAGMSQLSGIHLPEKPLKIGESFVATNVVPVQSIKIVVKAHCTFVGFKTINGRRAAELKLSLSSTGLAPTKGTGTQYIDAADGQMLSAQIDQTATASVQGKRIVVNNTMTFARKR
jgi:hypothetical protein